MAIKFRVKHINTNGAYNAARYKKAEAEKYKKPFLISFDGNEYSEKQMIEIAELICKIKGISQINLADQHKDSLIEVTMEFVEIDATKDPLYERAVLICEENGRISPSALQRNLRIGYARAKVLADQINQDKGDK